MEVNSLKSILRWKSEVDGIFSIKDLEVCLDKSSEATFFRAVNKLVDGGDLVKIKRGLYSTTDAKLSTISSRIYPDSYISTGTILAKDAIIGSVPSLKVQAIRKGKPKIFRTKLGTIEFLSISPKLFFGYERRENCNWATPEKAFLDTCYFYYKRKRFFFDPIEDVNMQLLDFKVIGHYLERYDKRFVSYFKKIWLENE